MKRRFVSSVVLATLIAVAGWVSQPAQAASGCDRTIDYDSLGGFPRVIVHGSWTSISPDDYVQLYVDWGTGYQSYGSSSANSDTLVFSNTYTVSGDYTGWVQLAGNVAGECVSDVYFYVHVD